MTGNTTRRSFVKGAALGGSLVAAGAFTGAALADDKAAAPVDEAKAAFDAQVAPIPPVEAPAVWDYETDVVIVGSGGGGLLSALRLADAGVKSIIVEKQNITGGTTRCGGFFVNWGGHRQANEAGWAWPSFPYDVDNILEYLNSTYMQLTGDPDLMRAMIIKGPECIDYMVDGLGIDFVPAGGPTGARSLYLKGSITKMNSININNELMNLMTQMVIDHGAEIHTGVGVENLVVEDGRVVGVRAVDFDGKEVWYRGTKAVFLMAGGFEMNRAMLAKYAPWTLPGIANSACPPFNYGEVIRMAQGVGADMCGYNSVALFDGGVWWREYDEYETELESHLNKDGNQALRQPWLRINQMGSRVPYWSSNGVPFPYDPNGGYNADGLTDLGSTDAMQPGGGVFCCFDSKYEQLCIDNTFAQGVCRKAKIIPEDDPLIDRVPDFQRDWRTGFQMMIDAGAVKKCDTIEELEKELGLQEGILVQNVEKWNEACAKGEDWVDNYKYDPSWLVPIDEPPYYGAKIGGHIFTTKCGVRINKNMEVIDTTGAVIPGLYAGWHTAGGSTGENNIAGRPGQALYGDVGQSFVGGFMAADALIETL